MCLHYVLSVVKMRVTQEHWQVFLQLAEENRGLISNKFNGSQGKAEGHALWQTIAIKLNALGYGQKTVAEWRKAVTDWKSKVKAKASKIKSGANQTGGGTPLINILTPLEERLLSLMGTKCIEGDSGVLELGLPGTSNHPASVASSSTAINSPSPAVVDDLPPLIEEDVLADHQYMVQTPTQKRKAEVPLQCSSTKTGVSKKRRIHSVSELSKELLEMTGQTVNILQNIDSNISKIANSLSELVNVLKSRNC